MQLGPAGKEDILVHDLVHERVREPVPAALAAVADLLDQIGLDEAADPASLASRSRRNCAQERLFELRTQHCGLLEQAPRHAGKLVDAGQQQSLQRRRNINGLASRRCTPSDRLDGRDILYPAGYGRSPQRTADCPPSAW